MLHKRFYTHDKLHKISMKDKAYVICAKMLKLVMNIFSYIALKHTFWEETEKWIVSLGMDNYHLIDSIG